MRLRVRAGPATMSGLETVMRPRYGFGRRVGIWLLVAAAWVACQGESEVGSPSVDSGVEEDFPTREGPPLDTGADTATEEVARVGHLSWALHPEMGSLVWVEWEQTTAEPSRVEYRVDPQELWIEAPVEPRVAGLNRQLLAGIPFSSELREPKGGGADPSGLEVLERQVAWRVVMLDDGAVVEAEDPIVPGPVNLDLPLPRVRLALAEQWSAGRYLLVSINQEHGGWTGGRYWVVIYDRKGRPVWARRVPNGNWSLFPAVSKRGNHLLFDESTYWASSDGGAGSKIHRTYLDAPIEAFPAPGLHHAFVELPGPPGTVAWGSVLPEHSDSEAIVERSPSGALEVVWACDGRWPDVQGVACESNSLHFDGSLNRYLMSFATAGSVVEISRATGEALWWAGDHPDSLAFDPVQSRFLRQHGVTRTPSGTVLVSTESATSQPYGKTGARSTMVREYTLDEARGRLTEVWSHDSGVLASTNGSALRLGNGNTLHVLGSASQVKEIDRAGRTVWHLDFEGSRLLGRGELIDDLYPLLSPVE